MNDEVTVKDRDLIVLLWIYFVLAGIAVAVMRWSTSEVLTEPQLDAAAFVLLGVLLIPALRVRRQSRGVTPLSWPRLAASLVVGAALVFALGLMLH